MSTLAFERTVTVLFLAAGAVVIVRNNFGRRGWIARQVVRFLVAFVAFLLVRIGLVKLGVASAWGEYIAIAIVTPVWASTELIRPRRRIPSKLRRKVVQRFEAKTGECYDPGAQHIDHKVPFSKHGGHTLDNLRVVPKGVNQKRGGKLPTLEDWIRIWTGRG
jgi:hypothetical protein